TYCRRLVRHQRAHDLRVALGEVEPDDRATAVTDDKRRRFACRPQDRDRIAALLADLEIPRIVPAAAGIAPAMVSDDLVVLGQDLSNERVEARVTAAAGDHQQRRPLPAHLIVDRVALGFDYTRMHDSIAPPASYSGPQLTASSAAQRTAP